MIRWRFILTRCTVVIAVLVLLRWGLGPVASFVTVRGIQLATGAKVEMASTRVGLFPPRVQYTDVRIADPRDGKQLRDALRADSIELVIDGNALLHRRWVAHSGRISGLQIGSKREVSGHFEQVEEIQSPSDTPSVLSQWIRGQRDQWTAEAAGWLDE